MKSLAPAHAHTKLKSVRTRLHAVSACLRHCQEEEKWNIGFALRASVKKVIGRKIVLTCLHFLITLFFQKWADKLTPFIDDTIRTANMEYDYNA